MLLPFVLLQYPLGKIADTKLGEKEIMAGGFLIMAGTTAALTLITTGTWWVWALALFATRVGASMVEDMSSIYFFKKTDERHAELVSFFQMVSPLSYVLGPLISATRVGASMVEDMSSIYFFKKTDERHAELVSFFQMVSPLSYVLGPLIA